MSAMCTVIETRNWLNKKKNPLINPEVENNGRNPGNLNTLEFIRNFYCFYFVLCRYKTLFLRRKA